MPKLITQRKNSRKRKAPPCGRIIDYFEAHSPFQKLVDGRRLEKKLSGRSISKLLGVAQSTFWIWMHNENGYPHPKAFKQVHMDKLSKVLDIPIAGLQSALDASRHLYTPRENPLPVEIRDAFANFINILENDRRQTVQISYVINLAKNLYNGATGEKL